MKNKNYFEGFEEKVKAMTAKEIILAMLDGIINPVMRVKMLTFGYIEDNVCYGCCATNMICKIANVKPIEVLPKHGIKSGLHEHGDFIERFEMAIDYLRSCEFYHYNVMASAMGFSRIQNHTSLFVLPINDFNYKHTSIHDRWLKLAELQD